MSADLGAALRRAAHPPVRDARFWVVQVMVLLIAGAHVSDLFGDAGPKLLTEGLPLTVLIVPVGYAALRYGLTGSAATGIWATLLWLPFIALPDGHDGVLTDLLDLAVVDLVAFVAGHRIEQERLAHKRAQQATTERLAMVTLYQQLFRANHAPILVLDQDHRVADANSSAVALFGPAVVGQPAQSLLGPALVPAARAGRVVSLDGRDYRVNLVSLAGDQSVAAQQVVLEDVTEERSEGRRASEYAALVVRTEEEQRQRLARELHDEPLQLFLHLARRLRGLARTAQLPPLVGEGLDEACQQALAAAARLRSIARDLRPPALDELGLAAALSSLMADVEDEEGVVAELHVHNLKGRLRPEVELGAFRIVQEAVRNTVRHAGASLVDVVLDAGGDNLSVTVSDNGAGFAPTGTGGVGAGHFGILGMAERARLLGGRLELRSAPGEGTVVQASIPLAGPPAPAGQVAVPGAGRAVLAV
jgi:signal transduction histidine kinase